MAGVHIDFSQVQMRGSDGPGTADIALRTEKVGVWYSSTQALRDISIEIPKNRIVAFIGPSGCGKTTLLKCFNRMNDIVPGFRLEGKISLHGEDLYGDSRSPIQIRKRIGMVFQQPNPFPMTIYDNLRLPIAENMPHLGKSEVQRIIVEKLKATNLYEEVRDRLHKSALRLSGGQQQRLCMARALVLEPEILLLDEPCSALDHISTFKIENLLVELKKKYTVVIVTHNLQQATRIADHVAFFYQGRIEEQGPAQEVFLRPKSELTAKYLHGAY
jgi:phosphate transport system ATP-binding protein